MSIKHLLKRMVLNTSLHRSTGLTATVKAEAGVKDAKSTLKKSHDIHVTVLNIRNTPPLGHSFSPAQRLMGRRTLSTLPLSAELLKPEPPDPWTVCSEITRRKEASKAQYDKHARPSLLPLPLDSHVYAKPRPPQRGTPWIYGQVVENPSPSSYRPGRLIRMPKKFEDYSLYQELLPLLENLINCYLARTVPVPRNIVHCSHLFFSFVNVSFFSVFISSTMACLLAVHLRDDIFTRMSFYFIFEEGGMSRYRCVTAHVFSLCIRRFPDDSLLL